MLKPKEIAQISLSLWYLPADKLEQVKTLVLQLREAHGYPEPIDDSDGQEVDAARPVFGSCQGMLSIVSEDDEHLKDFEEYMK